MAIGTLVGFNATRCVTTADTTITTAPAYVCARLVANSTAAATLHVCNGNTAAASRIATLSAVTRAADEMGVPVRCPDGVKVQLSTNTAQAFIYTR